MAEMQEDVENAKTRKEVEDVHAKKRYVKKRHGRPGPARAGQGLPGPARRPQIANICEFGQTGKTGWACTYVRAVKGF